MKRGILFTLGAFFIASIILILAILIFRNTEESQERILEVASLDRVSDLYSSVEKSFREVFNIYTNITINIATNPDNTTNVSIEDFVGSPFNDYSKTFDEKMINLEQFIETRDTNIILDLGSLNTVNEKIPLIILPHEINYTHKLDLGKIKIVVSPLKAPYPFKSYNVYINTDNNPGTLIQEIIPIGSSPTGTGFMLTITAEDYSSNLFSESYTLDIAQNNRFDINLNTGSINLEIDKGELTIKAPQETFIKTTIGNLDPTPKKVEVTYPKNIINITFPALGITKIATIAVA